MIFLSHNFKDKPVVEPIAIKLQEIFGINKVFYDSWSIQPGDGIIDKMSEGLEQCQYFFLFVSKNSLDSNMVKLEWQNALIKAVKSELRIIPIRIDYSLIPPVLLQTLYLDLFTNGLENTLKQMCDVIIGKNTFTPQFTKFNNLKAEIIDNGDINIDIIAKYIMEPRSYFIILLKNEQSEAEVKIRGNGMSYNGFTPNMELNNGVVGNGWLIGVPQPTIPGFPLELLIKKISKAPIKIMTILHQIEKDQWESIEM